jgi:hypothetical protein
MANETIPLWLTGDGLTAIAVTGLTVNPATGALTAGASASLLATCDSVRLEDVVENEDIRPVTSRKINNVITGQGVRLVLVEILRKVVGPTLGAVRYTNDYIRVTFTRGVNTYTGDFVRGPFTDGVTAFGKNVVELNLEPIDNTQINPVYS